MPTPTATTSLEGSEAEDADIVLEEYHSGEENGAEEEKR